MRPLASLAPIVGLVTVFCVVIYAGVGILMAVTGHPFSYFSRDPAATLEAHPAVGVLTYTGVLIVWGTAVSCLLLSALLSRTRVRNPAPLVVAGVGIAYIAVDDLLQFHEKLFPRLGASQDLVLGVYVVLPVVYLWWYRAFFREHEWPLLALALLFLGASIAFDQFGSFVLVGDRKRFVEEGLKLFGYSLLATYFVRLGLRLHDSAYARSPTNAK
jgi:hypothetical protein